MMKFVIILIVVSTTVFAQNSRDVKIWAPGKGSIAYVQAANLLREANEEDTAALQNECISLGGVVAGKVYAATSFSKPIVYGTCRVPTK